MPYAKPCETQYDAVIVGARCAGAATALLLARAGAKILLVDRQKCGSDTVSTHALMRAGVLQLKRWELLPNLMAAGTPRVTRTTFHYGEETIGIDIKREHGVDYLCAPRRTVLDHLLVEAAREAGAVVHHRVSLTDLQFGSDGRVTGAYLKDATGKEVSVTSDIVIGADGRQSMVARLAGAQIYAKGAGASGYVYGYYNGVPNDGFHWYFEKDVAAGVIPTNENQHCLFVGVPRYRFAETFRKDLDGGFQRTAAANSPVLRDAIGRARLVGRLRGFAGSPGFLRQSYGPGWALVGDAGYFKDPLTAHGITDALRDAELLSNAVLNGRARAFVRYQDERDALSRDLFDVTDAVASFNWDIDEIKDLNGRLSAAMKVEADRVAKFSPPTVLAA